MRYFVSNQEDLFGMSDSDIHPATILDVDRFLDSVDTFGCDTETEGEFNFVNKVIMLQVGNKEDQYVIDTRCTDVSILARHFSNKEKIKIFHNSKFDRNFLKFSFGFEVESIYDTFLVECCVTNGLQDRQLGLAALTIKYCNATLDKSERGKFINYGSKPFTAKQIVYGAEDVTYLMDIVDKQMVTVKEMQLESVVELENKVILALADIEYNGMILDTKQWLELAEDAEDEMIKIEGDLEELVLKEPKLKKYVLQYVQHDLFGETCPKKTSIKWTSPLMMLKVFKDLGMRDIDSSGEKEITKYQNTYPLVKAFIDYKKQQKLATTYGRDFLNNINKKTGRIHTNIWPILETHRISTSNPNLQQIPAMTIKNSQGIDIHPYLECFVAPVGHMIVAADFSGQELRIIAQGSKDPLWIEVFKRDGDLHGEVAKKIFNVDDPKKLEEFVYVGETKVFMRGKKPRDVTKTINFMLAYGGGKKKLSEILGISREDADVIITGYFRIVPRVKKFLDALGKYGTNNGYIRSYKPYSLVRQFGDPRLMNDAQIADVVRASMNTPIQGTAAIMTKIALINLREEIKKVPYKVELFMQVHDSIMCYVPDEHAEEWSKIHSKVMKEAGEVFIDAIPVKSDITISKYWKK